MLLFIEKVTNPDPKHPLADSDGLVGAVGEPGHGEQEAGKAPDGKDGEDGEVAHHFAE